MLESAAARWPLRLLPNVTRRGDGPSPNANPLILRRAVLLCAVALPLVVFNIFASSQQNQTVLYWSLLATAVFTAFAIAFIIWATRNMASQFTGAKTCV